MAVTISFFPVEVRLARFLARSRYEANRAAGVTDAQMGDDPSFDVDLIGALGELAFCRWANVYPDLSIEPRSGGYDAIVARQRIDVKATRRDDGNLIATCKTADDPADIYVLAHIVGQNHAHLLGWTYGRCLCRDERIRDLGHGPTFFMRQSELMPMESF